jgi:hypothetical protein
MVSILHIVKDVMKHHFIHLFIHPSIRSSIRPVMVCLLQRGRKRVEYRRGVAKKAIGRDGTHAKALQS